MIPQRASGRQRIRIALLVSVLVHVGITGLLALLMNRPLTPLTPKQGDALMVELSNIEQPRPGTPAGRVLEQPRPAPPLPPAKRERPPAPAVKSPPAQRPVPPAPPRVAAAPPEPAPPRAATPPALAPPPSTEPQTGPAAPAPPTAAPPPSPAPEAVAKSADPAPARPAVSGDSPRVASVPPDSGSAPGGRPMPDLRALRGTGGVGTGRGGIEGEAISLNSDDPKLADYLQRVKRAIERHWAWPCMKKPGASECEYTSANLHVEFGILKNGTLQFIELRQTSGLAPYDESAMTAIKLASPFPAVPPALMAKVSRSSTGVPITAQFIYHYEVTIKSLLR